MKRPIKTKYYRRYEIEDMGEIFVQHELICTNSSMDANRAVSQCVYHMQINHYGADVAEVYDDDTGELHAQVSFNINEGMWIEYQRDPRKYERRIAASALFGD